MKPDKPPTVGKIKKQKSSRAGLIVKQNISEVHSQRNSISGLSHRAPESMKEPNLDLVGQSSIESSSLASNRAKLMQINSQLKQLDLPKAVFINEPE